MNVRVGLWRKLSTEELMLLNCGVGEDSWESLGLQGDPTSHKELTYWKRPWCCEGMGAGGKGDDRGWDGWMASPIGWTWVWVNSGSWWWTGRPGVLWFMGSQRVGRDWATELNVRSATAVSWLNLLAVKRLSRVFSNTTVQKHQFFGAQLSS